MEDLQSSALPLGYVPKFIVYLYYHRRSLLVKILEEKENGETPSAERR